MKKINSHNCGRLAVYIIFANWSKWAINLTVYLNNINIILNNINIILNNINIILNNLDYVM